MVIYLVYMFCTLFWADSLGVSDLSKYARRIVYVLVFVTVTIHLAQSYPAFLKKSVAILCWAAAIVALGSMIIFYAKTPFSSRLWGYALLYSPIKASAQYGIVVILSIYLLLRQQSMQTRLLYLAVVLINFSYVFLSHSRGTLISLVLAIVTWQLFVWFLLSDDRHNYRKKLSLVFASFFAVGIALAIAYPEFFRTSFLQRGLTYRGEIWRGVLVQVREAPWLGHGLTAIARSFAADGTVHYDAHSVYLATLFYGGIVGLLFLVAMLVSTFWSGFRRAKTSGDLLLMCLFLYGALWIGPNGDILIHHPKPFWLFFWFPLALILAWQSGAHPFHAVLDSSEKMRTTCATRLPS